MGTKDPEFRNEKRDFELLIRLSKATRLLSKCSCEDVNEILEDLHVKSYTDNALQATEEDKDLCPIDFLVLLLKSHSKVIAHAAVKTLLTLSTSLRKSRSAWVPFLLRLWTAAQHWATATSSSCCDIGEEEHGSGQTSGIETVKKHSSARLKREWSIVIDQTVISVGRNNLLAASYAIQILQSILKGYIKGSVEALEDLGTFFLLFTENILGVARSTCTSQTPSRTLNDMHPFKRQKHEEKLLFDLCCETPSGCLSRELLLGSVLRLLCTASLITNDSIVNFPSLCETHAVDTFLEIIEKLIPIFSQSVLAPHFKCTGESCIHPFLSHKLLTLMIRLAECFKQRPSLASACFNCIHPYWANLLGFSLGDSAPSEVNSLDGTPFVTSVVHGLHSTKASASCSLLRHLQRRALYILFKMASTSLHCLSKPHNASSLGQAVIVPGIEQQEQGEESLRLNQLLMQTLIEWLNQQGQPAAVTCELKVAAGCMQEYDLPGHLAKSLVQFYLDEIHYSSSVLVDFLISKESGTLCLLYLMRSLQIISMSWPEFLKSAPSVSGCCGPTLQIEEVNTPMIIHSLQRDTLCSQNLGNINEKMLEGKLNQWHSSCQRSTVACEERTHLEKESNTPDVCYSDVNQMAKRAVVTKAADCLLQLKLSIERLYQRSLFPYNPSVLLKRFGLAMEHLGEFLPESTMFIS